MSEVTLVSVIITIVGAVLFYFGFKQWGLYNQIKNTPTSKVRSLAAGFGEIVGNIVPIDLLVSPLTKTNCVYYKYKIEEEIERVVIRKGERKIERDWRTIDSEELAKSFYLQDDTGKVEVGAAIDMPEAHVKENYHKEIFNGINPGELTEFIAMNNIRFSSQKRRFSEWVIKPDEKVYILGTAVPREGVVSEKREDLLIFKKGPVNKMFFISTSGEKGALGHLALQTILLLVGGIIGVAVGIFILLNGV